VESTLGRGGRVAVGDRVGLQLLEDALHLLPGQRPASDAPLEGVTSDATMS
jgi:hypothetical protein